MKPPTPEREKHDKEVACIALATLPYIISASDLQTALNAYNEAVNRKDRQSLRQLYMDLLIATCKYDNQVRRITSPLKLCSRTMRDKIVEYMHTPSTRGAVIESSFQDLRILGAAKQILTPTKSTACMTPLAPDALPSYEYMAALAKYHHTFLEAETQIPARSLLFLNCARGQDDLSHQEGYKEVTAHLTNVLYKRQITANDLEWLKAISNDKREFAYTLTNLINEVKKRGALCSHFLEHNPEVSRYLQQYLGIDAPDDSSITDLLARIGCNSPLYRPLGLLPSQKALPFDGAAALAAPTLARGRRGRHAMQRRSYLQDQQRERKEEKINLMKQVRKCIYMRVAGNKTEADDAFYRRCAQLNNAYLLADVRLAALPRPTFTTPKQAGTLTPAQRIHHSLRQRNQQAQVVKSASSASSSSSAASSSERHESSASSNVSDASDLDSLAIRLADFSEIKQEASAPRINLHPIEEGDSECVVRLPLLLRSQL